mmetsp:Transcript_81864/g.144990  ORF Transcript_81864/g.144990 Transcript_81864/m.144990 type:complete len:97 (+) Transcript_81864:73-363(+)
MQINAGTLRPAICIQAPGGAAAAAAAAGAAAAAAAAAATLAAAVQMTGKAYQRLFFHSLVHTLQSGTAKQHRRHTATMAQVENGKRRTMDYTRSST